MCTLALVLLLLTVSHAAYPGRHPQHHGQPGTPRHDKPPQRPERFSVPEPSADVLLLLGIGVTGLVSYGVQRRKRGA
jgi:hypothetical protein